MADIFSTNVLMGVVANLKQPSSFFLDRYFPSVSTEDSEEIHFDVIIKARRLAPFVSPLVEGKVVTGQGFTTKTFKPAYVKDKRVWDGSRALKRSAGEQIGGSLSPMQRMQAVLANELTDQLEMLVRRKEWMAVQILRTGAVTVVGDNYPSVSVNFGRNNAQTVTLTGGNRWGQAGINPLDSLQDWQQIALQQAGVNMTDVVMDVATWKVFRADTNVKDRLTLQRSLGQLPSMDQSAQMLQGATFMGSIDGFNIFVYSEWYVDDNGAEQPMLPSGTVIMAGDVQGVQAHGAIRDEAAGYQAVPYFPKSWVEQDPAVRFLLMQSAPLPVPTRVDGTFCATVL